MKYCNNYIQLDLIQYLLYYIRISKKGVSIQASSTAETTLSMELVHHADDLDTLEQLVSNGASINYQASNGWCLLFELCILGMDTSIEHFVAQGMDLELRDTKGRSVLYWAIYTEQTHIVKMLVRLGYNTKEDVYPFLSAKEYAQHKGYTDILHYL